MATAVPSMIETKAAGVAAPATQPLVRTRSCRRARQIEGYHFRRRPEGRPVSCVNDSPTRSWRPPLRSTSASDLFLDERIFPSGMNAPISSSGV
jgi:hypothetical protein